MPVDAKQPMEQKLNDENEKAKKTMQMPKNALAESKDEEKPT